jgi:hypothetical protein
VYPFHFCHPERSERSPLNAHPFYCNLQHLQHLFQIEHKFDKIGRIADINFKLSIIWKDEREVQWKCIVTSASKH